MNIDDIEKANVWLATLKELKQKRALILYDKGLGITIQGAYQSDEFVNVIRPSVIHELDKQIFEVRHLLIDLGVDLD